jgi:hypothetical protein
LTVLLQSGFLDDLSVRLFETPGGLVLGIGLVAVLIGGILAIYLFRTRKRRVERRKQSELAYLQAIERFGLSPTESNLVDELCRFTPRGTECYELMHEEHLYTHCEQKLLARRPDRDRELARLKTKLGYGTMDETQRLGSTRELPVDIPVYFEQEDIRRFGGTVTEVGADAFAVRLDSRTVPPPVDTTLTAQLRRREGRYRFSTTVLDVTDRTMHLAHAEGLEPTDQRLFFRKRVNAAAQARKTGSSERPVHATVEDISAGGCTVSTPEHRFQPGDHVELTLQSRPPIRLVGQVLRESDEGRKLHLSFETLRRPVRDRLIAYIQSA